MRAPSVPRYCVGATFLGDGDVDPEATEEDSLVGGGDSNSVMLYLLRRHGLDSSTSSLTILLARMLLRWQNPLC